MFPPLKDLSVVVWNYLAEGNDSIILKYCGFQNSPYFEHVLRIFKIPKPGFEKDASKPPPNHLEKVKTHQKYLSIFVKPYLQEVDGGNPVMLVKSFLVEIAAKIEQFRSSERRKSTSVDLSSQIGILHFNHIRPNKISIEVKPKCGFLPSSPLIPDDSVKRKISRFQMHQILKKQQGQIDNYTQYDPLDLFSGDLKRIKLAIRHLVETPQSFLKVFRDQKKDKLYEKDIDWFSQFLFENNVLSQLLSIQKLDFFDIENSAKILSKSGTPSWSQLINDQKVIEIYQTFFRSDFKLPSTKSETETFLNNLDSTSAKAFLAGFLVSQGSKDCSLMFEFSDAGIFEKLSVVDIDVKHSDLISSFYFPQDQKIVQSYLQQQK